MDSLSASKSSPIWGFSFHAPLSFCCQQIKPKFSWEQFETFASIERFAFSGDVVYLTAFIPVMFEITKDLTSATQSMLFIVCVSAQSRLGFASRTDWTATQGQASLIPSLLSGMEARC